MITVRWFDEQRGALLWIIPREFSVDDYQAAVEETLRLAGGSTRFDVVADFSRTLRLPPRFITTMHNLHRMAVVNYGVTIIYGARPLVELSLQILEQIGSLQGKVFLAGNCYEAQKILASRGSARIV